MSGQADSNPALLHIIPMGYCTKILTAIHCEHLPISTKSNLSKYVFPDAFRRPNGLAYLKCFQWLTSTSFSLPPFNLLEAGFGRRSHLEFQSHFEVIKMSLRTHTYFNATAARAVPIIDHQMALRCKKT